MHLVKGFNELESRLEEKRGQGERPGTEDQPSE